MGGGWAETKTGFCSSSDSPIIRKRPDREEYHFLVKIFFKYGLLIFQNNVANTKTDIQLVLKLVMTYSSYSSLVPPFFLLQETVNPTSICVGSLICIIGTLFMQTKIFLWISRINGYYSSTTKHLLFCWESLQNRPEATEGEKPVLRNSH